MPEALTLWSLAVLLIGGLLYTAMSRSTSSSPPRADLKDDMYLFVAGATAVGKFSLAFATRSSDVIFLAAAGCLVGANGSSPR